MKREQVLPRVIALVSHSALIKRAVPMKTYRYYSNPTGSQRERQKKKKRKKEKEKKRERESTEQTGGRIHVIRARLRFISILISQIDASTRN